MQFVKPIPFRDAIDKLGSRSPIGSKLSSSEWSDVPVQLRDRAMFSSRVESIRFLQRTKDGLGDFLANNLETLPSGETALATSGRAAFIEQLRQMALREGMGPLDGKKGGLTDITSERRLGLIFDVQTQQAQDFGYRKQGLDPDVLNEFPAQRFIRVKDVKEPRDWHTQFLDQVYLKTDPIWKTINRDFNVPWGPWGWGCGHDVEDVDRAEAEELGLLQPGQRIEAPEEEFNDNLQASTKGLDPELIEKLKNAFGDQLVIEDDTMKWGGSATGRLPAAPAAPTAPAPAVVPAPAPASVPTPTPAPTPAAPRITRNPNAAPVSKALEVKVTGTLKESVRTALAAIDKVHDDGVLPQIPVRGRTDKNALGMLAAVGHPAIGFKSVFIGVKRSGAWPALTTAHEIGHFLDLEAIGKKGFFSSPSPDSPLKKVIEAARSSQGLKSIEERLATTKSFEQARIYRYLLEPEEVWARAYAQFIAERSDNATLRAELKKAIEHTSYRQWSTEDFAPIAREIEIVFREMGWL